MTGGEGGIRTHDTLTSMPHFECGAFNHSTTSPCRRLPSRNDCPRDQPRVDGMAQERGGSPGSRPTTRSTAKRPQVEICRETRILDCATRLATTGHECKCFRRGSPARRYAGSSRGPPIRRIFATEGHRCELRKAGLHRRCEALGTAGGGKGPARARAIQDGRATAF